MIERTADAIIIGGGPAGYTAAIRMAHLGLKPILVEKGNLGGTCTNTGCIPTKALLHAAQVVRDARKGGRMGILAEGATIDFERLQSWCSFVVEKVRRGIDYQLRSNRVEVVHGEASFVDGRTVKVMPSGDIFRSDRVLIATGSRPSDLPALRLDSKSILSSDEIFGMRTLPRKLAIVGGGVIGVEMATAFAYLGSSVSIIELTGQLLPGFDPSLVKPVHDSLTKSGVDVNIKCSVEESSHLEDGSVKLSLTDGREVIADLVLVSVGRRPNTESLSLERAGVKVEKGFIKVSESLDTSASGIYAAGDVVGLPFLAHKAMDQGYRIAEMWSRGDGLPKQVPIPSVIYSDPEIAVVGMDERECSARGLDIITGEHTFGSSGRAQTLGKMEGFVRVIGERGTHRLLGVSMVGPSVSELIGGCSVMISASLRLEDLAQSSFPHPSLSEAIVDAARAALDGVEGKTRD